MSTKKDFSYSRNSFEHADESPRLDDVHAVNRVASKE